MIEKELEKKYKKGYPNAPSLENLDRLILKAGARIQNLMESMEDETNKDVRKLLSLRIGDLQAEKQQFEEERDVVSRLTVQWEEAYKALQRFQVWCGNIHQRVADGEEISYKEKSEAVDRLGMKIVIFHASVKERWNMTESPPDEREP